MSAGAPSIKLALANPTLTGAEQSILAAQTEQNASHCPSVTSLDHADVPTGSSASRDHRQLGSGLQCRNAFNV